MAKNKKVNPSLVPIFIISFMIAGILNIGFGDGSFGLSTLIINALLISLPVFLVYKLYKKTQK